MESRVTPTEYFVSAVNRGDLECVEHALDYFKVSPDVRFGKNYHTAVHVAASKNNVDLLKLLISYGADCRLMSLERKSSFDLALAAESWECLEIIVRQPFAKPQVQKPAPAYEYPEVPEARSSFLNHSGIPSTSTSGLFSPKVTSSPSSSSSSTDLNQARFDLYLDWPSF